MSRTDVWMPLYIGDYLADTMHLSGPEHGAYLLLLMHYWRNGPLLDDDRTLAGIARTERRVWEREIGPAVRPFFVPEDGRLHQKRMDAERAKSGDISSKRRAAAHARHQQTTSKCNANASGDVGSTAAEQTETMFTNSAETNRNDANSFQGINAANSLNLHNPDDANAQHLDTHAGARPSASPSQSHLQEEEVSFASLTPPSSRAAPRKRVGLSKSEIDDAFTTWWVNYPRKVGKIDARREFEKALAKVGWNPEVLITGLLMRLDEFDQREGGKFIVHPERWLRSGRWSDGDETPPQSDASPSLPLH